MGGESSRPVERIIIDEDKPIAYESDIYRSTSGFRQGLSYYFPDYPNVRSPAQLIKKCAEKFGDKPCLGERTIDYTGSFANYRFLSYNEVYSKVRQFSAGLNSIGVKEGSYVGLFFDNCILWQISLLAINMLKATSILVSDSLSLDKMLSIFNEASCEVIIVGKDKLDFLISYLPKMPRIKKVIMLNCDIHNYIAVENVEYYVSFEIFNAGSIWQCSYPLQDPNDDAVIIFTTGTTDKPKGCILTNSNLIAGASGFSDLGESLDEKDVYISYMPLSHIYSLNVELNMMARGAAIGYYTGSMKNLLSDIKELRPTIICGYPRLWNKVYQTIQDNIEKCGYTEKHFLKYLINYKIHALNSNENPSMLLDNLFLTKISEFLGSRVRMIVSGGAPLKPEVCEYLRATVTPNIIQGYGMTEASGCISAQSPRSTSNLGSGVICPCCEVKLRRVEGMKYNPQGHPSTGEILVRGPNVFKGYFNDEKATNEVFLEGGWLKTSDIGLITESGEIQIIDRISNFVKVSSGRYISLQSMSSIMESVEGVKSAFVYADSHNDKPVAFVYPSKIFQSIWKGKGIKDLSKCEEASNEMKQRINKKIEQLHYSKCNLVSKVIIIEDEETAKSKGKLLLTDLRKLYQDHILSC